MVAGVRGRAGTGSLAARRAVLDERSRIARDLHADVVPGLRQALAAAEREPRQTSLLRRCARCSRMSRRRCRPACDPARDRRPGSGAGVARRARRGAVGRRASPSTSPIPAGVDGHAPPDDRGRRVPGRGPRARQCRPPRARQSCPGQRSAQRQTPSTWRSATTGRASARTRSPRRSGTAGAASPTWPPKVPRAARWSRSAPGPGGVGTAGDVRLAGRCGPRVVRGSPRAPGQGTSRFRTTSIPPDAAVAQVRATRHGRSHGATAQAPRCRARVRGTPRGQGLAEYALILALIAIIAIIALIFLGGQISKILSDVGNSI